VIKARTGVELITSGELLVVDEKGVEVPADGQSLGEIVVRGNVVMDGYYHDPEATERAMGDGWFHTGDAAVLHPDGYVEIRDRIKDVIISGGENISSVEVEGVAAAPPGGGGGGHRRAPAREMGRGPHAYVVLRERGSPATEPRSSRSPADRLAHFKAPHGVTFVTELPRPRPARSRSTCCAAARPTWPASNSQRPVLRQAGGGDGPAGVEEARLGRHVHVQKSVAPARHEQRPGRRVRGGQGDPRPADGRVQVGQHGEHRIPGPGVPAGRRQRQVDDAVLGPFARPRCRPPAARHRARRQTGCPAGRAAQAS
jgi:hypothetical protein